MLPTVHRQGTRIAGCTGCGARKNDAGAVIAIEMRGPSSYLILEKFPQDGTWFGVGGDWDTLACARKVAGMIDGRAARETDRLEFSS